MTFRIEIAGALATGKSTLCDELAARGYAIIPERLEENFALKRAYKNSAARGLDVQMAFLISKASAIDTFETMADIVVCDYAMIVEYAYAEMHLGKADRTAMNLCNAYADKRREQTGNPDLLVYLHCPVEEQMRRVRTRGRDFEQGLTPAYVGELNDLIDKAVRERLSGSCPVLAIDTSRPLPAGTSLADKVMTEVTRLRALRSIPHPVFPAP